MTWRLAAYFVIGIVPVLHGQDTLTLANDSVLIGNVIKTDEQFVWFSKLDDSSSSMRIPLDRVKSIHGKNYHINLTLGSSGKYSIPVFDSLPQNNQNIQDHAQRDAQRMYKGYKPAARGVFFMSLLGTPALGFIGVAATTSGELQMKNMNLESNPNRSNVLYLDAYKAKAKSIKNKKVWKNFALGSVCSIAVITIAVGAVGSINGSIY